MEHERLGERTHRRSENIEEHTESVPGKRTLTEGLHNQPVESLIARARASGGAGLDPDLRASLEDVLGISLEGVRVHDSGLADEAARAVDADAFAIDQDVFFAAGHHDRSTREGRALIAHEVAHTVQQRGATGTPGVSSPSDGLEVEADRFASAFIGGGPAAPVRTSTASRTIARQARGTAPQIARSRFEIMLDRPAAVVGQPTRFTVPGAEPHTRPGARYLCTWTIHFDEAAARAKNHALVDELRPTQAWSQPWVTYNFDLAGTHRVVCDVRWEGRGKAPDEPTFRIEKTITTRELDAISRDALADYDRMRDQQRVGRVITEATNPEAAAAGKDHDVLSHELKGKITPGKHVPIRAVISDGKSGKSYPLSLVIGPAARGFLLLDLTRGVKRAEYPGATPAAALDALRSGNSYPKGLLELEVPANDHGIPAAQHKFATTGMSELEEWAHALGLVSIGLAGAATLFTGGLAAPLLVWASTATAAISAGVTLADDLKAAKLDRTTIIIDVAQLTASLLPFVGPATKLARGARDIVEVAQIPGRWIQLGQLALDGAGAIMISVDAYERLAAELAKPDAQGPDREKHIILFIAQLVQQGLIIGVSAKTISPASTVKPPRSKVNDETKRLLDQVHPDQRLRVEWVENGVRHEGEMTARDFSRKLEDPLVTSADIDAVMRPPNQHAQERTPADDVRAKELADMHRDLVGAAADITATYEAKRAEAAARLANGRNWLAEFAANADMIVVQRGQVSVQLVQDLTLVTGREVGLFRMKNGDRVLTLGWVNETLRPADDQVKRLILHSHPSGEMRFSPGDQHYFQKMLQHAGERGTGQSTSIIVTPVRAGADADVRRLATRGDDTRGPADR